MTIHIITKLARQVEGELIFCNVVAAFSDKTKADNFLRNYSYKKAEVIDGIGCLVEVGVLYDIEVE